MTGPHSADLLTPDLDGLAHLALAHFEREEAFLDTICEQLREIHTALLDNNQAALHQVLQRQSEMERRQAAFRLERAGFCRRAAASLGVAPEDIRLAWLAQRLGGESARLLERLRRRLEAKLQEAEQTRQRIASLAHCCLSFLQRFFLDLTGGGAGRYSPTGSHPETACGSFIEVRG